MEKIHPTGQSVKLLLKHTYESLLLPDRRTVDFPNTVEWATVKRPQQPSSSDGINQNQKSQPNTFSSIFFSSESSSNSGLGTVLLRQSLQPGDTAGTFDWRRNWDLRAFLPGLSSHLMWTLICQASWRLLVPPANRWCPASALIRIVVCVCAPFETVRIDALIVTFNQSWLTDIERCSLPPVHSVWYDFLPFRSRAPDCAGNRAERFHPARRWIKSDWRSSSKTYKSSGFSFSSVSGVFLCFFVRCPPWASACLSLRLSNRARSTWHDLQVLLAAKVVILVNWSN